MRNRNYLSRKCHRHPCRQPRKIANAISSATTRYRRSPMRRWDTKPSHPARSPGGVNKASLTAPSSSAAKTSPCGGLQPESRSMTRLGLAACRRRLPSGGFSELTRRAPLPQKIAATGRTRTCTSLRTTDLQPAPFTISATGVLRAAS